jgi:nitrite transporter NirC
MLYQDTVETVAANAVKKAQFLNQHPLGYLLASMLAGAYIGLGIILIYSIGAPLAAASDPSKQALMGASFAIALSLVIIAGAELFTGNNMTMVCGSWMKKTTTSQLLGVWITSWVGNLIGSVALAAIVWSSGAIIMKADVFVTSAALAKVSAPFWALFWRAALCNWLVCLAVWCSARATSEAGKLVMIFWCLFAFIGSGFEHSVANMTLLSLAMFMPHPEDLTWAACAYNVGVVTLGNIVGGSVFVAGSYCYACRSPARDTVAASARAIRETA